MFGRGPFWGGSWGGPWGGPFMRRRGFPLMGGFGLGMGSGSLLGDLTAGGIGYMLGKGSAQQQAPIPQYQPPQYQAPQYQAPQYQPPNPQYQPQPAQANNERLAQLKLLGHLRDSNLLTNDEFEEEKQKILHG